MSKRNRPIIGNGNKLVDPNALKGLSDSQRGQLAARDYKAALARIAEEYNCRFGIVRDKEAEKQMLSGINLRMRFFNWVVGVRYNPVYKITLDALPYPNPSAESLPVSETKQASPLGNKES